MNIRLFDFKSHLFAFNLQNYELFLENEKKFLKKLQLGMVFIVLAHLQGEKVTQLSSVRFFGYDVTKMNKNATQIFKNYWNIRVVDCRMSAGDAPGRLVSTIRRCIQTWVGGAQYILYYWVTLYDYEALYIYKCANNR